MEKSALFNDGSHGNDNSKNDWGRLINAVFGFVFGLFTLILSASVLREGPLQIGNYIGKNPKYYDNYYYEGFTFPTDIQGCCAATVAVSILQLTCSLMYVSKDLTYNTWKWAKFVFANVYLACYIILTQNQQKINLNKLNYYNVYSISLLGNSIYCILIVISNVLLSCRRNKNY